MTIRDFQWSFTDTLATPGPLTLIASTGTVLCPNSLDTEPLGAYLSENTASDTQLSANVNTYRELGGGERMWVIVDITTAVVASGGAATIDFQLITSASSSLGTPTVMYDFGAVAKGTLVAGYRLIGALPRSTAWLQYVGLQFVIATNNITAGACMAWIGWDVDAVDLGGASGFTIK